MDKNNSFKFEKKKKKKDLYCPNCGKYGHYYKNCLEPTTSYGIIIYKRVLRKNRQSDNLYCLKNKNKNYLIDNNINIDFYYEKNFKNINEEENKFINNEENYIEESDDDDTFDKLNNTIFNLIPNVKNNPMVHKNFDYENEDIYYLLIRRKDSLSFVEFMRGRYNLNDIDFIYRMFSEMCIHEREWIKNKTFEEIWNYLWKNENGKNHKTEFDISFNKLNKIKNGYFVNNKLISLDVILEETKSIYNYPEWGFPKGRRNNREKDIETSEREFQEESGFRQGEYNIIKQIKPISETFTGSNNVLYKHIYFLAHSPFDKIPKINPLNFHQSSEVGDIGWFKYEDIVNNYFRKYDVEKIELLSELDKILNLYKFSDENIIVI